MTSGHPTGSVFGKLWCPGRSYFSRRTLFSCVSNVVQVSAVSIARAVSVQPDADRPLPPHLEDIVAVSHPSLGDEGRTTLKYILHQYVHVFPAPGNPVTGRTQVV